MSKMDAIKQLFSDKKNEEIYLAYSPEEVVKALGFKDALRLAYRLLYHRKWEEEMQLYSIKLILAVKDQFPEEWDKDWRYEGFLGSAYNVVLGDDRNYDERYYAYKRAYEKANPPPPELLINLADCFDAPGEPLISYEEAIDLLNRSFEIEPYSTAAGLLCSIYWNKRDQEKSDYWKGIKEELQAKGKRPPPYRTCFRKRRLQVKPSLNFANLWP